ncbi:hypothetical protein [Saccharibacillus deserti]|uniref:hypothetical protein n=1 Tax=Saccharibacillus deserti TaxID=1634444 RepID=UPI0015546738|nr:hypothetical protein [Saccharibacillus deserti]
MKTKWMMIGLIAVLTACGGEKTQVNNEGDTPTERAAVVEPTSEETQADQSGTEETVKADVPPATDAIQSDDPATTANTNPSVDEDTQANVDTSDVIEDYADYDPQSVVEMVQQGALNSYSAQPVGEVIENFFSNPEWRHFKSEEEDDIVEFTGDALYEEEAHTTIQFMLHEDVTFELGESG